MYNFFFEWIGDFNLDCSESFPTFIDRNTVAYIVLHNRE